MKRILIFAAAGLAAGATPAMAQSFGDHHGRPAYRVDGHASRGYGYDYGYGYGSGWNGSGYYDRYDAPRHAYRDRDYRHERREIRHERREHGARREHGYRGW